MKACFLDKYPELMNDSEELVDSLAHEWNSWVNCSEWDVEDISILEHFPKAIGLTMSKNEVVDAAPLVFLDSTEYIYMGWNNINEVPDLSHLQNLKVCDFQANTIVDMPLYPAGIENINVGFNQIEDFGDLSGYPSLRAFHGYNNFVTEVRGLEGLFELKVLNIPGNPGITSIPDLDHLDSLEQFNVGACSIESLGNLNDNPQLVSVGLGWNNLRDLPEIDLSNDPQLTLGGNFFTFEDLVPLTAWDKFEEKVQNYKNQQTWKLNETFQAKVDEPWEWELPFDGDVTTSYYLWFKDGEQIDSTTSNTLLIPNVKPSDEGSYSVEIYNSVLTDMTIKAKMVEMVVVSDFEAEEPYAFSPNGDGYADYFQIEETGRALIYDNAGNMVRELQAPVFWDGTNAEGVMLDYGYYIIVINETTRLGVTLAR